MRIYKCYSCNMDFMEGVPFNIFALEGKKMKKLQHTNGHKRLTMTTIQQNSKGHVRNTIH